MVPILESYKFAASLPSKIKLALMSVKDRVNCLIYRFLPKK